jgi:PKD repeat protein
MDKIKSYGSLTTAISCFAVVVLLQGISFAGAPILSGVNPTLTPHIAMGDANPAGYTVSSFLNPIVTDGTLLDDFEDGNITSKWGGTWTTWSAGVGTVFPQYPFTAPSAGGYNNSQYCGKMTFTLAGQAGLVYLPYVLISVGLKPDLTACDLTKATGFRYWYKGSKHKFRVETTDNYLQYTRCDTFPSSPTAWKQVSITWDSLFLDNGATTPALNKTLGRSLTWLVQQPDGYTDSLLIDNVEVLGFSDRGIAVTGTDNANGAWQYSINAGTNWTAFGALSDASATLLNDAAKIRFVPNAAFSGSATFVFRAWNQTDNKANGTTAQAVVPNGGVTAYSYVAATGTVQVQNTTLTPPSNLTYSMNPASYMTGTAITPNIPSSGGGAVTSYSVAPALPAGLTLNTTTGVITGTPTTVTATANYIVTATNAAGFSTTSLSITVTVALVAPSNATITPTPQNVLVGSAYVSFTVNVGTGTPPYTYQWKKDGVNMPGKTTQTLTIAPVALTDAGSYTVVVTNAAGSTTSSVGVLTVTVPVKALFTVSDSIAKMPASIQFTDKSTGVFTKRLWYFGDGTIDTTNIQNPVHLYDSASTFYAKLVLLNGTQRVDSMIVSIIISNSDLVPVIIPYQPSVTLERRPVLRWHPVAGASAYTFVIDDNADFSSPISSFPLSDTSYKLLADLPFGAIFWKVKSNLIDIWSAVDKFTVLPDSIPDLIRYNGDSISTKRPVFAWHPVANASGYKIEIANNTNFTNATSLTVADTTFTPLADLSTGIWYWHVSCGRNYALFAPADSLKIKTTSLGGKKLSGDMKPFVNITKSTMGFSIFVSGYERGSVHVELYSARGELTAVFSNIGSGQTMVHWDSKDRFGKKCVNGVYILRICVPGKVITDRIIVQR